MDRLAEIDRNHIWHPFTTLTGSSPIFVESAAGVYLHCLGGRRIIDAISSWWVNLHGHAHPDIVHAVAEQAAKMEHVIFAGFTHEPAITLAQNLLHILPRNQSHVFYSDDGSTAVEVALKMAIQYWHNRGIPRKKIIAIEGAYHGDTFGSMSAGARGLFTDPFSRYLFPTDFIPFPEEGEEEKSVQALDDLLRGGGVGAFIFEPLLQGAAGMRIYKPAVLDRMIALAHRHNVLCIADEVLTGFGRTGKMFACDYLSEKPDIIALSKGLTGGTLPLGATSCSDEVASAFRSDELSKTFLHGHSYTANPLACAAANASFRLLTQPSCKENIERISRKHAKFVLSLNGHSGVRRARSLGTVLAIELETEESTQYANPVRKKIYEYFLERNILLRPLGNVVYVLPPYVISDAELDQIYQAIVDFLSGK